MTSDKDVTSDKDDESSSSSMVTLRVHRFQPRPDRDRGRSSSPFGSRRSPFGSSPSPARRRRGREWIQDYTIATRPEDTILDCLQRIRRTMDPTLAFRYACGHGMCGSDAVCVNGTPTLLCTATVADWAKAPRTDPGFRRTGDVSSDSVEASTKDPTEPDAADASARTADENADGTVTQPPVIEIAALPGFPVIRDLVVDIDPMFQQIRRLDPHLVGAQDAPTGSGSTEGGLRTASREYPQTPEQLSRYELLSDCIACGVCEGSCPVYAGGEAFVGPAALVAASRFINDSRDVRTDERLDAIDTEDGVAACQSVRACSRQCPRGIDVGEEIWRLVAKVKERQV